MLNAVPNKTAIPDPERPPHLVRKRVGKLVSGLKSRVRENDLEGLSSALIRAPRSPQMLRALREQKIVLQGPIAHRLEVAELLVRYVRAEHPTDAEHFERTQRASRSRWRTTCADTPNRAAISSGP